MRFTTPENGEQRTGRDVGNGMEVRVFGNFCQRKGGSRTSVYKCGAAALAAIGAESIKKREKEIQVFHTVINESICSRIFAVLFGVMILVCTAFYSSAFCVAGLRQLRATFSKNLSISGAHRVKLWFQKL